MYARILTFITAIIFGGFFTYVSFSLEAKVELKTTNKDFIYEASFTGEDIAFQVVEDPSRVWTPTKIYYRDIARLDFSFFQTAKTESPDESLTFSGASIFVGSGAYILGFYDPFQYHHIIHSGFRLEEVTNGSFYVDTEDDGTISIYSLDGVGRIFFVSGGKDMTSMFLFPGNYIRFDPQRNAELDDVDLFRIILSLDTGSNQTFEYVNPKIDASENIINYRFGEKNILIRLFHRHLQKKVENVDEIVRKYGNSSVFAGVNDSPFFVNPTKKTHFLLLSLSSELAKTVDFSASSTGSIHNIKKIYNDAESAGIRQPVKETLEQFIIDGRYATYGAVVNAQFDQIYTAIASMIGITPGNKKFKTLQDLSNIYAKNIVSRNETGRITRLDVYEATASILKDSISTLDGITSKDLFDVAVYAFNILVKAENGSEYSREYLLNPSTYSLLETFFKASNLYYNAIEAPDKRRAAIHTFAIQFYKRIFYAFSRGITTTFTDTHDDGYIFLAREFRNDDKPKIDRLLVAGIRSIVSEAKKILLLLDQLDAEWQAPIADSVKSSISESITITDNFLYMIENYREYVKNPTNTLTSLNRSTLTNATVDTEVVVAPKKQEETKPVEEPPIDTLSLLAKLFPLLDPAEQISVKDGIYTLKNVQLSLSDGSGGRHDILLSATYNSDTKFFTAMTVDYKWFTIGISPSKIAIGIFWRYLLWMWDYFKKVDDLMVSQGNINGDIIFALQENKLFVAGQTIPLTNE